MGDGSLSQDEIDALLKGADDMLAPAADAGGGAGAAQMSGLSPTERDALAEMLNNVMIAVAPSLSGYLQKTIKISNAFVEVKTSDAVMSELTRKYIQVSMNYTGSVNGRNLIILDMNDAAVISSLMMGEESGAAPAELTEAHQSTLQEFVSQLLSSSATQLAQKTGGGINTSPPTLSVANSGNELQLPMGELVKITYNINVEGVINSKFYHIMEVGLASELVKTVARPAAPAQDFSAQAPVGGGGGGGVGISPVKFPPLGEGMPVGVSQNIGLLMDVQLTLTVELGRTKQLVKDILGLGEGSIIELDKLAGEPVDLLVNNKLIAKGEVVVIDENFGVRITDIVSPSDRLTKIGSEAGGM